MPDTTESAVARQRARSIRFDIARADDGGRNGRQLLVFVDDVEMTSEGAGMGIDPRELLVRRNRLIASNVPHRIPIARCSCGEYGCGSTDVTIVRDGEVVHWDWHVEVPVPHGITFDAETYDREVARIGAQDPAVVAD
ncbi:hypothetical protein IDH50_17355 [Aeromicrobium tamlense]|uniref:Uncharacterized protein n=1 Tax=Aeromicrobium tamlense TaxID=375541 RepID=A0A8I0KID6_9ACTN|nr:hypothetical protein [Aeromicrobium tamlense]MBD1272016.1 hypothetical protein [Aeromicrobium tamlense]NYI38792.1 hypothetical protein [Aeromicrobium tamlense]